MLMEIPMHRTEILAERRNPDQGNQTSDTASEEVTGRLQAVPGASAGGCTQISATKLMDPALGLRHSKETIHLECSGQKGHCSIPGILKLSTAA